MLRVRGLSLRYPNGKLALVRLRSDGSGRRAVVVLGGNGSGKTTLLRCITRALKPTAGEVWLDETESLRARRARSCGARGSSWR